METVGWWLRLNGREQAGHLPIARALLGFRRLGWWGGCVVLPSILHFNAAASATALDLLLSVDVPLTLALAAGVTLRARSIAGRRNSTRWLWPRALEPQRVRWLFRLRWMGLLQWPAGLAWAALLLSSGAHHGYDGAAELLLSGLVGLGVGVAAALAVGQRSSAPRGESRGTATSRALGMAALPRTPFREVRDYLDLRRLMMVAAPVMLAVPVGASAGDVAAALLLWLPLAWLVLVIREAIGVDRRMRRWLVGARISNAAISFHIWRHVAILFVLLLVTSMLLGEISP